jgi:hypothetical protein
LGIAQCSLSLFSWVFGYSSVLALFVFVSEETKVGYTKVGFRWVFGYSSVLALFVFGSEETPRWVFGYSSVLALFVFVSEEI